MVKILDFYKQQGQWYLDLPEEVATQAECLMVGNTPEIFELLASKQENKKQVKLIISYKPLASHDFHFTLKNIGVSSTQLEEWGHEQVDSGAYYRLLDINSDYIHESIKHLTSDVKQQPIWICPTTVKVFGHYPEELFIKHVI